MKIRYILHIMFLFCSIGGLLVASPAFGEDIERSCQAHYTVYVQYGPPTQRAPGPGVPLPMKDSEFSARRGCGSTVPNRCRQRACEAITQCMAAHATMGNAAARTMPAACTSNGVEKYAITNLEKAVQETVCSHLKWDKQKGRWENEPDLNNIDLWGDISGDEGCSKHYHINYFKVSCPPPAR